MPRVTVVWLALFAVLLCAPAAARAQGLQPTVSTSYGVVTPSYVSGSERPRLGDGPTLIKDGWGLNPPALLADPGSVVTITLAAAADAVFVYLGAVTLPVAAAGERTYTVTLPADAVLPAKFGFRVESSTETTLLTDGWTLNLGGVVVDPVPTPTPAPTAAPVPLPVPRPEPIATVGRSSLRLTGKRLAVTVACPLTAPKGCAGTLTLRRRACGSRACSSRTSPPGPTPR